MRKAACLDQALFEVEAQLYSTVSLLNNVVHVSISPAEENRESGKVPTIGKVMHKSRFQPSKRASRF